MAKLQLDITYYWLSVILKRLINPFLQANLNPAEVKYQSFASKWLKVEASLSLCNKNFTIKRKLEKSSLQSQVMVSLVMFNSKQK